MHQRQSDQKYCFSCGKLLHASAHLCPECGASFTREATALTVSVESPDSTLAEGESKHITKSNHHFCTGCGEQVHDTAVSCPKCGAKQSAVQVGGSKNKVTAGLLAIFLGGIGVHHFYLRNIGLGILYLLFFWTYIPALVGFIEGIFLLVRSDESFNRRYNQS